MVNALMKLVRANIVLIVANLLTLRVEILAFVQARINILVPNHILRILTEVPERPAEANIRLVLVKAGINGTLLKEFANKKHLFVLVRINIIVRLMLLIT